MWALILQCAFFIWGTKVRIIFQLPFKFYLQHLDKYSFAGLSFELNQVVPRKTGFDKSNIKDRQKMIQTFKRAILC